jgi:hypothetical protein
MLRKVALCAFVIGCGDSPPAEVVGDPVEIIGREWTVEPGEEAYKCLGIQVDRDMYINQFQIANPLGEHHAVLTVTDRLGGLGGTRLGEHDCNVLTVDLQMLYASGVGTSPLVLPENVALKVEAGQFLHLNLHLFNSTDAVISSRSAILADLVEPVPADREAEMVFAGTFDIAIPPGETGQTAGGCTFSQDATLIAYWPHMHQFATHQKVTMNVGGEARTIHDEVYDFEHQNNFAFEPLLEVSAGDSIDVECTYTNTSQEMLEWGDSSNAEMCFAGLYRYPKQALTLFDCTESGM